METGKEGAIRRLKEKYWKVIKDVEAILGVGTESRPPNFLTIQVLCSVQS